MNYINDVKKRLKRYNSLILKSKYNKEISDKLIQTYVDARYYNYNLNDNLKSFYKKIDDALIKKCEEIIKEDSREKETIDNTLFFIQYYYYFDNVRKR